MSALAIRDAAARASVRRPRDRPKLPRLSHFAAGLLVPAALLAAWVLAAQLGRLPEQILPSPQTVLTALRDGVADGSLASNALASLHRVAEGFGFGAAAGLGLGLVLGLRPRLRDLVEPLVLAMSQVPILGWVPILVLFLGIDEALKVVVIAWASFLPVFLNTCQGVRGTAPKLIELGRVLSFSRWSMLRSVVLPAAAPSVFTGLREGIANGWQSLVAVELLGSFEGLGYLMAYGRQLFQLELVIAAMVVVGAVGLSIQILMTLVERRLVSWPAGVEA